MSVKSRLVQIGYHRARLVQLIKLTCQTLLVEAIFPPRRQQLVI